MRHRPEDLGNLSLKRSLNKLKGVSREALVHNVDVASNTSQRKIRAKKEQKEEQKKSKERAKKEQRKSKERARKSKKEQERE